MNYLLTIVFKKDDINHFEEVLTSSDKEEYMEEVASVFIKPEVIDTSPGTPSVDTDNVKSKTSEPEEVVNFSKLKLYLIFYCFQ